MTAFGKNKAVLLRGILLFFHEWLYTAIYFGVLALGVTAFYLSTGKEDAYRPDRWANGVVWLLFYGASWATGKSVNSEKYTWGLFWMDALEVGFAYVALMSLGYVRFLSELNVQNAPHTSLFMLFLTFNLALQQVWRRTLLVVEAKGQFPLKIVALVVFITAIFLAPLSTKANCVLSTILVVITIIYSVCQPKEISFLRQIAAKIHERGSKK